MASQSAKDKRIAELEAMLANHERTMLEVRNCHILLSILVARCGGGVAVTDQQMAAAGELGQLNVWRDDRIPGCVMFVRKPPLQ